MSDHPAVLRYANSFSRSGELEYDELLQVGRMAVWRAELAVERGLYDPHVASWDTYATNCVRLAMCKELANTRKRHIPMMGLGDEATIEDFADDSPAPDARLNFAALIQELPEDARAVVELLLGDAPGELLDAVLAGARGARGRLLSYVRRTLGLRRGDRAAAAFEAIAAALGT